MRTFLLISVLSCISAVNAQLPKSYLCCRASDSVVIDGRLDDSAWQKARWTDYFVDIEGDAKPVPRFKTRARMLWDDQYFYIGAQLDEPHVWATITKRDDVIFHDNDFEVFMDPNGDDFEYGEFEINALNTGWDLFLPKPYKDGGRADDSWNIEGIKTAVSVKGTLNYPADIDSGWNVEIAMPWASLERISHTKLCPKNGEQWRINFSRVEWMTHIFDGNYKKVEGKPEDNWVWSPQGVINMHRPEMWGIVQFSAKAPGSDTVRPDPYAEARLNLHRVYYVEHAYYEKHNRWTASLSDLSLGELTNSLAIALSDSGFTATMQMKSASVHIRQDSYFWISQ